MAIIKRNELSQMKEEAINVKLSELRKELIKINAQRSSKTMPENPGRVKEVKRTVAKLLTKLHSLPKGAKEVKKTYA